MMRHIFKIDDAKLVTKYSAISCHNPDQAHLMDRVFKKINFKILPEINLVLLALDLCLRGLLVNKDN